MLVYIHVHAGILWLVGKIKGRGYQRNIGMRRGDYIRHMTVPNQSIRPTGSWGYLAGSWREATPNFKTHFYICLEKNKQYAKM